MLKKRFRILRLPMLVKDMAEVEDIVIALTEVDAGFQEKRDLLTEHLRLVSGAGQCGARKFRWLKAATDCRPGFV